MTLPILYSFRRCPYAMRARMALAASGKRVALREIVLREKPEELLQASPKATVPVLQLPNGTVLDESLDIALWALAKNNPQGWLPSDGPERAKMLDFITRMDGPFKCHLDRTKYNIRYVVEGENAEAFEAHHRAEALAILRELEQRLEAATNLFGEQPSWADIATFPFIRQFANTDNHWWQAQDLPLLQAWLTRWVESPLFASVMEKYRPWKETGEEAVFPV